MTVKYKEMQVHKNTFKIHFVSQTAKDTETYP